MTRTAIGAGAAPYVQALAVSGGTTVYVSGQLAVGADNAVVGTDLETQARFVFARIGELLVMAGAGLGDIVKITAYVTTLDGYAAYGTVRREVFGDRLPTSTTVQVAGLVIPGCIIEIDAVAVVGP